MRARIAALAGHEKLDPKQRMAVVGAASPVQLPYWEKQVRAEHPDLDDAEVYRRADLRHRAHMTRLSLAASRARSAKRVGNGPSAA